MPLLGRCRTRYAEHIFPISMKSQTSTQTIDIPDTFAFEEESGGIEAYRLKENDLQVLLLPLPVAPVVTFMVTYRVGSRNEVSGHTGATHLLEHLMFKGTERFNRERNTSIFRVLQRVGARINASTWYDRTNYYELLPKEHLPLAMEIEADRMRNALIRPEDLASERSVVLNEFDRGENDPMRKLYHSVWSTAYVAHPYHHPTIGWRSDIENVTAEELRHYYDTFYWPDNTTISVIGDLDRRDILEQIHDRFGEISSAPEPIPEVKTTEPPQQGERRTIIRQAGQLGTVMISFKSPPARSTDTDALDVLSNVLASGKNSRLFQRLTDLGLTTDIFSQASRHRDPGLFTVFAALAPEASHEEVEQLILEEIQRIKDEGVSREEVERAVNQRVAQEAFGRDGPYSIASQLNEAIAAGDWKLYTEYLDRIRAVDRADVQQAAHKFCTSDTKTTGYYIPTQE